MSYSVRITVRVNVLCTNVLCKMQKEKENGARTYEADDAPDEVEVGQVVRVHRRRGVDLQCVVPVRRVLEQTVHRVHELVRQVKEPFPATPHNQ